MPGEGSTSSGRWTVTSWVFGPRASNCGVMPGPWDAVRSGILAELQVRSSSFRLRSAATSFGVLAVERAHCSGAPVSNFWTPVVAAPESPRAR